MKVNHISTIETSAIRYEKLTDFHSKGQPLPDGEYPMIRIPGIVALDDGSIIAYFECRQGGDLSAIDIAMRRSIDGGRTWGERIILSNGYRRNTKNNPVMIADGARVYFLHCENYKRLFCRISDDYGLTWGDDQELTDSFAAQMSIPWNDVAVGPGHGTKLSNGRLIVPMWCAYNPFDIFSHRPSVALSYYSDDSGKTWNIGELIDGVNPSEGTVEELTDGTVIMNIRNEHESKCRLIAKSKDYGSTWSELYLDEKLNDPICAAGMCRAGDDLLFSNCDNTLKDRQRINLTLRRSHDNGETWEKLLIDNLGGYSDVYYSKTRGMIYVIYESDNYRYIKIAEIDPQS